MPNWKKVIVSGSDAALNSLFVRTSVTASTVLVNTTSSADVIAGTDYLKIVASGSGGGANTTFGFSNNDNTGQGFISITNGTVTGYGVHVNNSDGLVYGTSTNHSITLRTTNTNRLYIDGTGKTYLIPTYVPTTAQNNVLTFNSTTGLICYTASSALGGGGAGFPYTGDAVISGSLTITGSGLVITGSISVTKGFTGSLFGTSSWASNALTASYGNITGSLFGTASWAFNSLTASYGNITGSLFGTSSWASNALTASYGNITGSLFGTSSWSNNSLTSSFVTASNVWGPFGTSSVDSSSYAATASYNPNIRVGVVPHTSFGQSLPTSAANVTASVTLTTPFSDSNYVVNLTINYPNRTSVTPVPPGAFALSVFNRTSTGFKIFAPITTSSFNGYAPLEVDYIAYKY